MSDSQPNERAASRTGPSRVHFFCEDAGTAAAAARAIENRRLGGHDVASRMGGVHAARAHYAGGSATPDLIVVEFANVLWKKVQREECDPAQAEEVLAAFDTDAPRLIESVPLVPRALELALRLGEVVYDCVYLAAAIEGEAGLVTADARLARCARSVLADVERVG